MLCLVKRSVLLAGLFLAAGPVAAADEINLADDSLSNPTAYIPPQCYTRTLGTQGRAHNPCYACHVASQPPNYINDVDFQLEYAFPQPAWDNHWVNLFKDRRLAVQLIGDEEILRYIRTGNHRRGDTLLLAARLRQPPKGWDVDGNGRWDGYTPDAWFHFDAQGFDRAPDGRYTGWRPMPTIRFSAPSGRPTAPPTTS